MPEFADLGTLPAADGSVWAFGRIGMGQTILHGPTADLGAVKFESVQAQGLGSGEAVRARWGAGQALSEEVEDGLGPGGGMVATGGAGEPRIALLARASPEEIGGERIEVTAGHAQLVGRFRGCQGALLEGRQHMPDECRRVAIG